MGKVRRKKTRSITIIGRRWFDSVNGNTYFTAQIWVNGEPVHTMEREYGYGSQYEYSAFDWLEENGYTPGREHAKVSGGVEAPWRYCERLGVSLITSVSDVRRKKDL